MLIKKPYFIFLLILCNSIIAQENNPAKPNYKKIEKNITEKNSDFFYPNLLNRFNNADSNLTINQKRHLYYGFIFQENYSPYQTSELEDSLKKVANKKKQSSIDWINIIKISDSILIVNPFDLGALNYKLYGYEKLNQPTKYNNTLLQFRIITDALLSSGDGLSKRTSFYVINTSHEYDIIALLGYDFGGKQSLVENFDYLSVELNEKETKGLFFDISPCLNSLKQMFK